MLELLQKKKTIIAQDISILKATSPSAESIQIIDSKLNGLSKEIHDEIRNQYRKIGAESLKHIIEDQICVLEKKSESISEEIDKENVVIDELKPKADQHAETIKLAKRQKEIESTLEKISKQKTELANHEKEFNQLLEEIENKHSEYKSGIQGILGTIDKKDFEYLSIDYQTAPKTDAYNQFIERNINMTKTKHINKLSR